MSRRSGLTPTKRRPRWRRLALAAAVVLAAGCGRGGDKAAKPEATPETGPGAAPASAPAAAARPGAPAASSFRLAQPTPDSLRTVAFAVDRPVEVEIEAVGLQPRLAEEYAVTCWLLDARTRRPVWSLEGTARQPTVDSRLLRQAKDRLTLAPGAYVLHLAAAEHWRTGAPFRSWDNVLNDIADVISREDLDKDRDQYFGRCFASVAQAGGAPALRPAVDPGPAEALLRLGPAGNDEDLAQGFRLARETTLRLRALGESMRDTARIIDAAWIERAADGAIVWRADGKAGRHAGGARKNREWDSEVSLPAGDYLARFATDDTHAWNAWNLVPPFDPSGYGLTILPGAGYQAGDLSLLDAAAVRRGSDLLAELLRVRDGEKRRQTFTLARTARVRIAAMAEGYEEPMADVCAILNVDTGRLAWQMKYDQTEPAGGARKNRRATAEIELPAGRYEAQVTADGSHGFGSWNAAPPDDPLQWGMVVRLVR